MPKTLTWPDSPEFWKKYNNFLTPEGGLQHRNLGKKLKERYVDGSDLFEGIPMHQIPRHVLARSSNSQRTVMSAWSLLGGMFPDVPHYVSHPDDRHAVDLAQVEEKLSSDNKSMGIAIHVEKNTKDFIFHEIKYDKSYKEWKKENIHASPQIKAWAGQKEYQDLVAKTYEITGKDAFNKTPAKGLAALKSVQTMIDIQNASGCMSALPNEDNAKYSAEQEKMVYEVAEEVFLRYFRPSENNKIINGKGKKAADYLGNEIASYMRANIESHHLKAAGKSGMQDDLRFIELSAHDTTVCALAARMGVDIRHPWFTGHWLFELHQEGGVSTPFVRVFYNPKPTEIDELGLEEGRIPFEGRFKDGKPTPDAEYVRWDALKAGDIPFEEFAAALTVPELSSKSQLLQSLHMYLGTDEQDTDAKKLHETLKESTMTDETLAPLMVAPLIKEKSLEAWKAIFNTAANTANSDGKLTPDELVSSFRQLDLHLEDADAHLLLNVFDLEGNGFLSESQFVLLCACATGELQPEYVATEIFGQKWIADDINDDDDDDDGDEGLQRSSSTLGGWE
jgi:Ca2+-binding EF-hand superfamily protein